MPYILRDATGLIIKASTNMLVDAEMVPHNHPDLVVFLQNRGQDPKQVEEVLHELRQTDADMARAVEDVIMVLLKKNLLKMTDLAKPVQDRMSKRVKLRVMLQYIYDQATNGKPIA